MHGIVFCDCIFRDARLRFEYKVALVCRVSCRTLRGVPLYSQRATRGTTPADPMTECCGYLQRILYPCQWACQTPCCFYWYYRFFNREIRYCIKTRSGFCARVSTIIKFSSIVMKMGQESVFRIITNIIWQLVFGKLIVQRWRRHARIAWSGCPLCNWRP